MIPKNICRDNIIRAIKYIDENGIPTDRQSVKYNIFYNDKYYPPKYVLSLANRFVNGEELVAAIFSGGLETNRYLEKLGFYINKKNKYPFKLYSWNFINHQIAIKTLDRSAFIHHGTGIPKEGREFFNIHNMEKGEHRKLNLIYNSKIYEAHFEMDFLNSPRTRLMWKSDFSNLLSDKLPDWYTYFKENKETENMAPEMRMTKDILNTDHFLIDFIYTYEIEKDISAETYEELNFKPEGAIKHIYCKKYERILENRKRAIEVHGTTCSICGFDYEKQYGPRGRGYIEVHHTKPLCSLKDEIVINPVTDLIPVCSNCHRIIHRRRDDVLSIDQMRSIYKK